MSTDTRNQTCEVRIDGELASTAETIQGFWTIEDNQESTEDQRDENFEEMSSYILGVSVSKVYTLQMSWGGPSDQFEVFKDEDGDTTKILYRFMDWFDGAERRVDLSSDEGKAIERYCDYILEGYSE